MVDRAVQNVPLVHTDEAEHRRLLALRANAIGYEQGAFTPEITFATPGDLSVVYTRQSGLYWRIGPLLFVHLLVAATPTFSTSSGALRIAGLPYASDPAVDTAYMQPVRLNGPGITWPSSLTDVVSFIRENEDWFELAVQGSAAAGANLTAADVTSAQAIQVFITGYYPVAANAS